MAYISRKSTATTRPEFLYSKCLLELLYPFYTLLLLLLYPDFFLDNMLLLRHFKLACISNASCFIVRVC